LQRKDIRHHLFSINIGKGVLFMSESVHKGVSAGHIKADIKKADHKNAYYPLMKVITSALPEPANPVEAALVY
jgi:hypothetical protein